jgi:hypothetical protein
MADLKCDKCASPIPAGSRFCPACADPVTAADEVGGQASPQTHRVRLLCPKCDHEALYDVAADGSASLVCGGCSIPFTTQVIAVRSKSSRGDKRAGHRSFSVRGRNLVGSDVLVEFDNSNYADFELKSKDLAAVSYLNGHLRVVQNLTLNLYMKVSKPGCYLATHVYGEGSEEVILLREWRDEVLLPSVLGAPTVALYYRTSPLLLRWFGSRGTFSRVALNILAPLVDQLHARRVSTERRWSGHP